METKFSAEPMELKKANGIINNFIKSCSHDFKSPLTSIEGLVMIAGYSTNQEEVNHCLTLIQQCALNMLNSIHKLEEYTIVQHRKLCNDDIQADQLVDKVVKEYSKEIDQQQIVVSTRIVQYSPWISDEQCNYLVLKNLVENAVNFIDREKKPNWINIKIDVSDEFVSLEVSDNGVGIADDEKEKIFEPFHRSSTQSKGSGLGLFLVKGIIEKLKASVTLSSIQKVGSSFLISIPNNKTL